MSTYNSFYSASPSNPNFCHYSSQPISSPSIANRLGPIPMIASSHTIRKYTRNFCYHTTSHLCTTYFSAFNFSNTLFPYSFKIPTFTPSFSQLQIYDATNYAYHPENSWIGIETRTIYQFGPETYKFRTVSYLERP